MKLLKVFPWNVTWQIKKIEKTTEEPQSDFSFSPITAYSLKLENQEYFQSKEKRFLHIIRFLREKNCSWNCSNLARDKSAHFLCTSEPSELCARRNQWVNLWIKIVSLKILLSRNEKSIGL